ncbi:PTS sugar transporter subunit IIB [Pelovirga terrestris]|uniref:PTS sugar transporter subunit IIB n=1 Tax=Pelovirga terrestris TaxID=2771352 RepID=A0A8J6QPD1_9BACT|nr:PTS sugar transporter subunit IIB [Pelovirga terrestris]MBD1401632.1 PTS sugar transporter subunit IIB [Pelovirga terrestris]
MNLVLTRIDNRLIHGQVLESWVPHVQANCIVVANDVLAANPLKKLMMKASVPSRMRVEIATVADAVQLLLTSTLDSYRVLLLFGTPADALQAYRLGLNYQQLNLGNLHADAGKARFSCTVFLALKDLDDLKSLEEAGVSITARCIPADTERSWRQLIPGRREAD